MTALWSELRFGLRALRRKPGFAAAAVLSLVLGIGTNTGVFSLLYSLYLQPLPVEGLDRLVAVFQTWRTESGEFVGQESLAYENHLDYREQGRTLEDLALHLQSPMSLSGGDVAEQVMGIYTTANYFDLLGVETSRGRFFTPEEDSPPDGLPVVVLSHGAWSRLFDRDPDILGRRVQINGLEHRIVGVGPEGFRGTELWINADLWLPAHRFRVLHPYRELFDYRDASIFRAVGRLPPGGTPEQVEAELTALSAGISETHFTPPDFMAASVRPFRETLLPSNERERFLGLGWTLIVGSAVILLIACLNVATLILVRGLERDREIAVRQAVGAGRPAVIRQLVIEGLALFVLGAALSLPVAWLTLRLLWQYRPPQFAENVVDLTLHPMALVFALGVALVTGVVFGLLPALRVSRVDLIHSLKEGSAPAASRSWLGLRLHPRSLLVAMQVALALVALVGSGLLYRSVVNLRAFDLGFDPDNLALMRISPGEQGMDEARGRDLYRRVLERLDALGEVESVALSENRLLRGAVAKMTLFVEGESHAAVSPLGDNHRTNSVSSGFFRTVGIPLLRGSDFDESIRPDGPPVVIINEFMAESLWPGEDAVGKRFRFNYATPSEPLVEVIGIAADARYRELRESPQFFLYRPLSQRHTDAVHIHARTVGDPGEMLPVLRREVQRVEPNLVVSDAHTMDYYLGTAMWIERLSMITFGAFGTLALALAMIGVYGVVSYTVRRMRRDLGIHRALGARPSAVLGRVLREALAVVGAGVVLGWMLAYFVLRPFIEDFLVEVHGGDPTVYAVQTLVLLGLAVVGTLVPAWRSLQVEPMSVLRDE